MNQNTLYEQDFFAWILHNAQLLRERKFSDIDIENIAEELESMGKRDKRELISHFRILIAHLLKWQFQPENRSGSWRGSITEQRFQINDQIKESPSLKQFLSEAIAKSYSKAVELASEETGLPVSFFPADSPYSPEKLLNKSFYPEN